ncbi:helix-turn-helix transcriptional regulator [Halegenticoccus tardaugens]|uniref:helix-turn-helix transcriptional regulator n=1 Tax=Halegenticoccus tardaugens TaxID=2071624 RepID=UPI00100BC6ED|nr:hypothetical protein [Halegenticoccus tardaugens]
MDPHDYLAFLSESQARMDLLRDLADQEVPITKSELASIRSTTRVTVHRNLDHMAEWRWVENDTEAKVRLTIAGRLVFRAYEKFCDRAGNEAPKFLGGSPHRPALLRYLADLDSTVGYSTLQAAITASQSTLTRILDGFTTRNWATQPSRNQYKLTDLGAQVAQAYTAFTGALDWVTTHAKLVNRLGTIGRILPLDALAHGDMVAVKARPADPDRAIEFYANRVREADPDTLVGITPVASPYLNEIHKTLLETGSTIDLIVDTTVLETAKARYPHSLKAAHDLPIELYCHPARLEFGLAIFDDQAILGAYNEHSGHLWACLSSTDRRFRDWAEDLFSQHRSRATEYRAEA